MFPPIASRADCNTPTTIGVLQDILLALQDQPQQEAGMQAAIDTQNGDLIWVVWELNETSGLRTYINPSTSNNLTPNIDFLPIPDEERSVKYRCYIAISNGSGYVAGDILEHCTLINPLDASPLQVISDSWFNVSQINAIATPILATIEPCADTAATEDTLQTVLLSLGNLATILSSIFAQVSAVNTNTSSISHTRSAISVTNQVVGSGYRGYSATLIGGGPQFTSGVGTYDGINVPVGFTFSIDGDDNGGVISNGVQLVATGGARWIVTRKS